MRSIRVVLDTNVIVSGLITRGNCRQLIMEVIRKGHRIIISKEIINEFLSVMKRDKFRMYVSYEDVLKYLSLLIVNADVIDVKTSVDICPDDMDNHIISTAIDGEADYIVTGDKKDLLPIGEYNKIRIVSVDEFLDIIREGI